MLRERRMRVRRGSLRCSSSSSSSSREGFCEKRGCICVCRLDVVINAWNAYCDELQVENG